MVALAQNEALPIAVVGMPGLPGYSPGVAAYGLSAILSGSIAMPSIFNPDTATQVSSYNITFGGLSPLTNYDTYVVAVDLYGNLQNISFRIVTSTLDNNPLLGELSVSGGGIVTPPFLPTLTYFDAFLNDSVAAVTIAAAPQSPNASLAINGVTITPATSATYRLAFGNNTYNLTVTAQDGRTTRSYMLGVNRVPVFSEFNSTLSVLSLIWTDVNGVTTVVNSTNMGGAQWPSCLLGCLPPPDSSADCSAVNPGCVMDSNQTLYYVSIPSSVSTVTVYAKTTSPLSNLTLYPNDVSSPDFPYLLSSFQGGQLHAANPNVSLYLLQSEGNNELKMLVRAPDGSQSLYIILVSRYGPGVYEGWQPVVPTTAMLGPRYSTYYAGDDPLTVRVLVDPTVENLDVIPRMDIVPPAFVATYPQAVAGQGQVTFKVMITKPGVCFYMILLQARRGAALRRVWCGAAPPPGRRGSSLRRAGRGAGSRGAGRLHGAHVRGRAGRQRAAVQRASRQCASLPARCQGAQATHLRAQLFCGPRGLSAPPALTCSALMPGVHAGPWVPDRVVRSHSGDHRGGHRRVRPNAAPQQAGLSAASPA